MRYDLWSVCVILVVVSVIWLVDLRLGSARSCMSSPRFLHHIEMISSSLLSLLLCDLHIFEFDLIEAYTKLITDVI